MRKERVDPRRGAGRVDEGQDAEQAHPASGDPATGPAPTTGIALPPDGDVVNLYAIRATDPADLRRVLRAGAGAAAAIGQDTDARIAAWVRGASLVIAAWGAHAEPGRALDVLGLVGRVRPDLPVYRLGPVTASGMPRHPLYRGATPRSRSTGRQRGPDDPRRFPLDPLPVLRYI